MTAVLLAEDDAGISDPLARALRREGYDVEVADDGPAALTAALSGRFGLLLLDLGLPELDGVDVCREVRAALPDLPVLILTARVEEVDAVIGLDAGADDYVTKPFRLAELLARVRALLRRGGPERLEAHGVRLDIGSRQAWKDGQELPLTNKEFELLHVLLRKAGTVVARDTLMREVWNLPWYSSSKTVDMHVSWLRRKLGDDANQPAYITTVRGVGFRFEAG